MIQSLVLKSMNFEKTKSWVPREDAGGRSPLASSHGVASMAAGKSLTQKSSKQEVKFMSTPIAAVGVDGVFEGYGSLFGIADLGGDVVVAGAFKDSLIKRGALGVKLLWSHDPAQPIGTWQILKEDVKGLYVRGQLDFAVAKAREVYALLKSGAVDGLSIGFKTQRSRKDIKTGGRRLEKVDLWEVSIVTFPMLPQARVSAVKRARTPVQPYTESETRAIARAIRRAAAVFNS